MHADANVIGSFGSTPQALLARDIIADVSARRMADLEFGELPLVFGRTDSTDREAFHIGRVSVLDEGADRSWSTGAHPPRSRSTAPPLPIRTVWCAGAVLRWLLPSRERLAEIGVLNPREQALLRRPTTAGWTAADLPLLDQLTRQLGRRGTPGGAGNRPTATSRWAPSSWEEVIGRMPGRRTFTAPS